MTYFRVRIEGWPDVFRHVVKVGGDNLEYCARLEKQVAAEHHGRRVTVSLADLSDHATYVAWNDFCLRTGVTQESGPAPGWVPGSW